MSDAVVRSEEELRVSTAQREAGRVSVRKVVTSEHVEDIVPRGIEYADVDRVPAGEDDTGEIETLPDGSISIPVFEEQLVVERRLVVRERILIRKHTVTEEHRVEAELRREVVDIETDEAVENRVAKRPLRANRSS